MYFRSTVLYLSRIGPTIEWFHICTGEELYNCPLLSKDGQTLLVLCGATKQSTGQTDWSSSITLTTSTAQSHTLSDSQTINARSDLIAPRTIK